MLSIVYNGTKPNITKCEYSIMGNNDVDHIEFSFGNGDMPNGTPYVKIKSKDGKYVDKIDATEYVQTDSTILFPLLVKTTAHKVILVQLSFETDETCFQTEIVEITLKNSINADGEIENNYPLILGSLQEQINELKGGSSYKTIFLEVMPTMIQFTATRFKGALRLNLINFTNKDIGSYIYLYNKTLGKKSHKYKVDGETIIKTRKQTYRHPANYDSESRSIMKLGYGVVAGKNLGSVQANFCEVPEFMYHNGYVQTEYEITAEHIEQGYMDIDIGKEFIALLRPQITNGNGNYDEDDNKWHFYHALSIMGNGQYITFYQVKDGEIKCYPKNCAYVISNSNDLDATQIVELDEQGDYRLRNQFQIKILPY